VILAMSCRGSCAVKDREVNTGAFDVQTFCPLTTNLAVRSARVASREVARPRFRTAGTTKPSAAVAARIALRWHRRSEGGPVHPDRRGETR
jgi:hypothetical protein